MFRRTIIATDLSSAAFAVLKNTAVLKVYGTEEILLLQCLGQVETGSYALTYITEALDKNLQEQKRVLEAQGFKVETRFALGVAKREIDRIAEEEDYSLIVTGVESCSLLSEPLLGGVGYEIIHYCRKPILLVRLEETRKEGLSYFEPVRCNFLDHVFFPTDFSETASEAFHIVKELVAAGTRKVTLMHVQEQSRIDPYLIQQLNKFNEKDEERLLEMKKELQQIGDVDVDTEIFYGSPSRDVLDAIEDRNVQLVVMGSQGRGYVKELFLGSVSHNVARHAKSSVLLIPARRT